MDEGFIFHSFITIWDANNNEKVKIGFWNLQRSVNCSYIWTLWSGKLHCGFNWSFEWKMWTMEAILSNLKCKILQISDKKRGFLALQISIVEWWNGLDGTRAMSHDNGWGE